MAMHFLIRQRSLNPIRRKPNTRYRSNHLLPDIDYLIAELNARLKTLHFLEQYKNATMLVTSLVL